MKYLQWGTMVVFIAEKPGTFSEVENYSRGLAGAELNFSIGVTRLGHTASYFTKLGKDPYGAYIHEFIEKEKIDGEKVLFAEEYLTGSYLKTKVLEGDPAVYYFRKIPLLLISVRRTLRRRICQE